MYNKQILFIYGRQNIDISKKLQLALCIRSVDDDLHVHEDTIRLPKILITSANEIVKLIIVINICKMFDFNFCVVVYLSLALNSPVKICSLIHICKKLYYVSTS